MIRSIICILGMAAILPASAQEADRSDWPNTVVIGTASPGGTHAIYGQGVASIISNHVGVSASTQQTQGPTQNLVLVHSDRINVGLTTMGPAYEAMQGELDLDPGTEYSDVRALFPMYITPFQAAALERSGISSVSDLAGRTIGAGPRGGTGGTYWARWLETLGVDASIQNGPLGDQTSQLADGRLDAVTTAAGLPIAAFSELETLAPTVFFGLSQEEIDTLRDTVPYAVEFTIPANTYSSQPEDIQTLAMWNVAFTNERMPESLAYEIVKAVFENQEELVATHASAKETLLENVAAANDFMPYHPGAVRYYREQGIELPEAVIPAEMAE
ncbi:MULTISPECIES: TAXI family TRAP transporter solute-binding subunit [Chelativorans]|uniref:TRAP transporter solute receptor, TAXI family n=1 Tax=Chelativorans sp. (strain BNC1) TaxID=266779 RepID=Q11C83_CHESB|nr:MULTISPECIES: TAXI family TRAP transporter solute-binding subunit [Chelativorans]